MPRMRMTLLSGALLFLGSFDAIVQAQSGEDQPEILVSTNAFREGWQIYALHPETGNLRPVATKFTDN